MEAGNFRYVLNATQIQRREPMEVNTAFRLLTSENMRMSNDLRQQSAVFEARFSRCHEMLHFLACRVLGIRRSFPQLASKNSYRRSFGDCPSERE
jgi:hypothetical protein